MNYYEYPSLKRACEDLAPMFFDDDLEPDATEEDVEEYRREYLRGRGALIEFDGGVICSIN